MLTTDGIQSGMATKVFLIEKYVVSIRHKITKQIHKANVLHHSRQ